MRGPNDLLESTIFIDRVGNRITAATAPSVGEQACLVMPSSLAADAGIYGDFPVPADYSSAPKIRITYILDGAPGASDVVQFGYRDRAVADNESADGTYAAEKTGSSTVGSSGDNYGDEDVVVEEITLTAGDYAAGDRVFYYLYYDNGSVTFGGDVLVIDLEFEYST